MVTWPLDVMRTTTILLLPHRVLPDVAHDVLLCINGAYRGAGAAAEREQVPGQGQGGGNGRSDRTWDPGGLARASEPSADRRGSTDRRGQAAAVGVRRSAAVSSTSQGRPG